MAYELTVAAQLADVQAALGIIPSTSVAAYGAVGDGVANDRAAIAAADAVGPVVFTEGTYLVSTNLTITNDVTFLPGAKLLIPNGVTVTFSGHVQAGAQWIFQRTGTGAVALNPAKNAQALAEWWGCAVGADCWADITAALASGAKVVQLAGLRDYNLSATLLIPAYTRLQGVRFIFEGAGLCTRLLATHQSAIVQLGASVYPGSINACPSSPELADVFVQRNALPTLASDNAGVAVLYSRNAVLERVWSDTSINSFLFFGSVACVAIDCRAKRSVISSTNPGDGTSDKWRGFYISGTSALGAAGSNASLRLVRPSSELNVVINDSECYRADGRFTDCFVYFPESVGASYALRLDGDATGAPTGSSNTDFTVIQPVFDQSLIRAIYITNVNKWGSVEISLPYLGPAAGEALRAANCAGAINVYGGQVRMGVTAGAAIIFDACRAPVLDGTIIGECRTQALVLNAVSAGRFEFTTINETQVLSAAVQLIATCVQNRIDVACIGGAAKVGIGHQSLAASNDFNEFNKTRLTTAVVGTKQSFGGGAEVGSITYGV